MREQASSANVIRHGLLAKCVAGGMVAAFRRRAWAIATREPGDEIGRIPAVFTGLAPSPRFAFENT